jgi:hypothetical protein
MSFKYLLDKSSKKHYCPGCGKRRFVKFVNIETNEYLPNEFGRCDRESKCGYFLYPEFPKEKKQVFIPFSKQQKIVSFDFDTFKSTLKADKYRMNVFLQNLLTNVPFPFEANDISKVIELYRLGTVSNGYRAGAITFPFIDIKDNIRTIQVKQFDKNNHTIGTDFLHSMIEKYYTRLNKPLPEWLESYIEQDIKVSCLFGEHLLMKYPNNPIGLVEAPKTAIYCTLYFGMPKPDKLIWLAVYNKSSFSFEKSKVLDGRLVYVFPDLSDKGSTFSQWQTKVKEFEKRLSTRFIFSNLLEQLALEQDKKNGNDIADFLIKLDWREFRKMQSNINTTKLKESKPLELGQKTLNDDFISSEFGETLIGENNSLILEPILKRISLLMEVNEIEAKQVLNKMIREKLIDVDYYGQYYLYHSTPF